ncbi:MAG TPA: SIMPL domain-containing protein [Candidatus Paceibacterota bacterium]|nr:SIMPL domain-containing protein [Candidatus Paceibacterota bacterium]
MISETQSTLLVRVGTAALVAGIFLMGAVGISAIKGMGDESAKDKQIATVTVNGEGDAYATADVVTLSFSVSKEAKEQKLASEFVNSTMQKLVDALTAAGLSKDDIKTLSYDLQPQYDYVQQVCPLAAPGYAQPCVPGTQKLRGYMVSQRIELTMRGSKNFDNAANILDIVTKNGATDVGQLNFKVENTDKVQAEARAKAIAQAKEKAEKLAGQLNVKLVRIANFNENNAIPYFGRGGMEYSKAMAADVSPAPVLPTGQNQYHSNVTITYEISGGK